MKLIRYQYPKTRYAGNVENWFEQVFSDFPGRSGLFGEDSSRKRIPVDLYDDEKSYYVVAELPGIEKKAVNVELEKSVLTIGAERLRKQGNGEEKLSLSRSIDLPEDINEEKVNATMENGILTISIPKTEAAKPKAITVT